jgi:uncharacterized NAD(P)/FAD-binding protein YdhS
MSSSQAHTCEIAIVGGGCSGTLVAVHLFRAAFSQRVVVVEPRERLGAGLAYSTSFDQHLLNVPAGRMSALPDNPAHFLRWLLARNWPNVNADSFVPRRLYAEYLKDFLDRTIGAANGSFTHIRAEAIASTRETSGARLTLSDGTTVDARRVVLALGNPASCPASQLRCGLEDSWHLSPWFKDALRVRFAGERILLLGTGLTSVDSMLALLGQETPSQVFMLSRRGLLPEVHDPPSLGAPSSPPSGGNLRMILRELRANINAASQSGLSWQPVIDALRPVSNDLWREMSSADKLTFLRHLKPYWEPHRHRMAAEVRARLDGYCETGALQIIAGSLQEICTRGRPNRVRILRRNGEAITLDVDRIISCTGIHENYKESQRPLIRSLLSHGLAQANDLGIGFRTDRHGALLDVRGNPSSAFFTLGPPRRGELLETTAVPEIRVQAEELARYLTVDQLAMASAAETCLKTGTG